MALTSAQMNDASYLANLINNLKSQQTDQLRQNEITTQQNMRKLRQNNALNGINGGFEESNYARLLAAQNKAAADINKQFTPQINEYQGYLDALRAAQAAAAARAAAGSGYGGSYTPAQISAAQQAVQSAKNIANAVAGAVSGSSSKTPSYEQQVRNAYALRDPDPIQSYANQLAYKGYSPQQMDKMITKRYG